MPAPRSLGREDRRGDRLCFTLTQLLWEGFLSQASLVLVQHFFLEVGGEMLEEG